MGLGFNEEESFVIREEGGDEVGELLGDPPPLELEDSQELKRFMFPEEVVQVCVQGGASRGVQGGGRGGSCVQRGAGWGVDIRRGGVDVSSGGLAAVL